MQRGLSLLPESPGGSGRKSRGFPKKSRGLRRFPVGSRQPSKGEAAFLRARARDYIYNQSVKTLNFLLARRTLGCAVASIFHPGMCSCTIWAKHDITLFRVVLGFLLLIMYPFVCCGKTDCTRWRQPKAMRTMRSIVPGPYNCRKMWERYFSAINFRGAIDGRGALCYHTQPF